MKTRRPSPTRAGLGPIRPDEVYPLADFRRRCGLGHKGVASAKRAGLRVIRFGRGAFVLGRDALAFFERLAAEQSGNGSPQRPVSRPDGADGLGSPATRRNATAGQSRGGRGHGAR